MTAPPPLRDMMAELVALPTVSSARPELDQPNRALVDTLAEWSESLGFTAEVRPVPGRTGKANLIARLGEGPGGLVLAGHTDTVPYDEGRWRHDPFRLTEADGRLYGLGTSDMKGFLALALEAARAHAGAHLVRPLVLLATADEESTMAGARALAEAGQAPGARAVIGEPTGLRPVHLHKGILMEAIRLTGRSGHSSDPSLGASALEGMHAAIGALLAWRDELQARHRDRRFQVPVPTLNLGRIEGGDSPNRICARCELHLDLRALPGMEPDALRRELRGRVGAAVGELGLDLEIETEPLFDGVPPFETPAGSDLVQAAERLTGRPAEAVAFSTEGPFFSRLGMETVILGPGDIAQAHQPDEFLALDRVEPMLRILEGLIQEFCVEAN